MLGLGIALDAAQADFPHALAFQHRQHIGDQPPPKALALMRAVNDEPADEGHVVLRMPPDQVHHGDQPLPREPAEEVLVRQRQPGRQGLQIRSKVVFVRVGPHVLVKQRIAPGHPQHLRHVRRGQFPHGEFT